MFLPNWLKIILFTLLFVHSAPGFAQEEGVDSIVELLKEAEEDTIKVHLLFSLCDKLRMTDPAEVVRCGEEALNLSQELEYLRGEALALKHIGIGYYYQGDFVECIGNWEKSLDIYEQMGDKAGTANLLTNLGAVHSSEGDEALAIDLFLRSMQIAREIKDTLRLVTGMINIGLVYLNNPATHDKALDHYLKAIPLSEQIGDLDAIGTASVNMGEIYYERGDYSTALGFYEKALDAFRESGTGDVSYALLNIAKVHTRRAEFAEAWETLDEALALVTATDSKQGMVKVHIGFAESYREMRDYESAIQHYSKAMKIARNIGAVHELRYVYEGLAFINATLGKYKAAYSYQYMLTALRDTILSEDSQRQINKLEVQYKTEAMHKDIEILQRDLQLGVVRSKQQMTIIYFLIVGFAVISVLMILLFRAMNQKRKANEELVRKNELITEQKQAITDSIQYASKIQNAMLTPGDYIDSLLPERFILYRPRDIVSGDFYFLTEKEDKIVCAIADCTGHGVPGAFMSMLGIAFLNEIISNKNDVDAGQILNELREYVIKALHQSEDSKIPDGMDIALIIVNKSNNSLQYAGAHNPLYLLRDGELIEYKADKMPIGIHENESDPFTNHNIEVRKGDTFYAFSDGFQDQFGGPKNKKFQIRNFKSLLLQIHGESMLKQKRMLEEAIDSWMDRTEQIDDILVMGIRI